MLSRMFGGFVLVRLISWLLVRVTFVKSPALNLFVLHATTLALLALLQIALRAPLGGYAPQQAIVLLPGALVWLCYDLIYLLATTPARNESGR